MNGDILDLSAVLEMLASGGLIGVALVFLGKYVPALQRLSENAKFWLVFACFVLVPVLAQLAVLNVDPGTIATLAPYWRAAMMGLMAWDTYQGAGRLAKGSNGGNA